MKSFSIDPDTCTAAVAGSKQTDNAFRSEAELYQLTADWPLSRLVEIWNSIPGFTAVKKFTDRKTAVARIWKAIQNLESGRAANVVPTETAASSEPPAKKATAPKHSAKVGKLVRKPPVTEPIARPGSKTAEVLTMLRQPLGATLLQLMEATGWQAHSVRGFISGTVGKKMRLPVTSAKGEDGLRRYSVTA